LGAHPGFIVESMEEYFLALEKDELLLSRLQNGLLSSNKEKLILKDKKLPLKKELFYKDALIFENSQINNVLLCSSRTGRKITMKCEQWPYFGIWSKKGCDSFVCLEPWYGITDTIDTDQQLKNKKGIIQLSPQKTFSCSFELIFD
jgi:galactose mutarotase-like enzyme